jgi:hypothetical protein
VHIEVSGDLPLRAAAQRAPPDDWGEPQ